MLFFDFSGHKNLNDDDAICKSWRNSNLVVVSLNDLNEQCRSVLAGLGEDLQEVSLIIEINQDMQFLESIHVFFHLKFQLLC